MAASLFLALLLAGETADLGRANQIGEHFSTSGSITLQSKDAALLRTENRSDAAFVPVEWSRIPSAASLPRGFVFDTSPAQASMFCKLALNGRLTNCRVDDAAPEADSWRRYAKKLGENYFITTQSFAKRMKGKLKWVTLDIEIQNKDAEMAGRCITAFCFIHHGAPPPPPPRRENDRR